MFLLRNSMSEEVAGRDASVAMSEKEERDMRRGS